MAKKQELHSIAYPIFGICAILAIASLPCYVTGNPGVSATDDNEAIITIDLLNAAGWPFPGFRFFDGTKGLRVPATTGISTLFSGLNPKGFDLSITFRSTHSGYLFYHGDESIGNFRKLALYLSVTNRLYIYYRTASMLIGNHGRLTYDPRTTKGGPSLLDGLGHTVVFSLSQDGRSVSLSIDGKIVFRGNLAGNIDYSPCPGKSNCVTMIGMRPSADDPAGTYIFQGFMGPNILSVRPNGISDTTASTTKITPTLKLGPGEINLLRGALPLFSTYSIPGGSLVFDGNGAARIIQRFFLDPRGFSVDIEFTAIPGYSGYLIYKGDPTGSKRNLGIYLGDNFITIYMRSSASSYDNLRFSYKLDVTTGIKHYLNLDLMRDTVKGVSYISLSIDGKKLLNKIFPGTWLDCDQNTQTSCVAYLGQRASSNNDGGAYKFEGSISSVIFKKAPVWARGSGTQSPTPTPTALPTIPPTSVPSEEPTTTPTDAPTTSSPTGNPTSSPSTRDPTMTPTTTPTTPKPSAMPTSLPTTTDPTQDPTAIPTSKDPTVEPSTTPTFAPTSQPSTLQPTSQSPTVEPTTTPTSAPTPPIPTLQPTSQNPTKEPTTTPTAAPSTNTPTIKPNTFAPSSVPTQSPTEKNCVNSLHWRYDDLQGKDCEWVSRRTNKRCTMKDNRGIRADQACPKACDITCLRYNNLSTSNQATHKSMIITTVNPKTKPHLLTTKVMEACVDDISWRNKGRFGQGCNWVGEKPGARCAPKSEAFISCPKTCRTCNILMTT
eukprot:UC4_evm1s1249